MALHRTAESVLPDSIDSDIQTLQRDGIIARKRAFSREFIEQMREDMMTAFWQAIQRPGGTVGRGPRRWYVEVHPQAISGFAELATHPWFVAMCERVLGPEYKIVEIGFDVPFQGAKRQPWHRDFRMPRETRDQHRLTSLAFNLTGVDVAEDMGPFEIAPGTQWEEGANWNHGMFPPKEEWARYEPLGVRKFPKMGDVSARTALTIHRGTEHHSPTPRPALILGVVAAEVANPDEHDLEVSRAFYESLSEQIRAHLLARVVDEVKPITQRHDIEGLVMGVEE